MKTVFITGCADGIGRHLSEVFYTKGYAVIATDINNSLLEAKTKHWDKAKTLTLKLDVTKPDDWQNAITQTLSKFKTIDVFINNAGVITPGYITDFPLKDVDFQVDVNIKGVMYGSKFAATVMQQQGHGHLINMASLAGVSPVHGMPIYCATKYAVRGFTLSIAMELNDKGIDVSVICPFLVKTNMLDLQLDYEASALTFSGVTLTVEDIEKAVFNDALVKKKLEILVPKGKGWEAKIGNMFPVMANYLIKGMLKKGLKKQAKLKK